MFGKFVFLLFAVCFISQGSEARSMSPFSLEDVAQAIQELIQKVKDALAQLPALIKDLEEKIKEIISKLNIPEIVAGIKKQIEDIIKAAGVNLEDAAHCIIEEEKATESLVDEAGKAVEKCMADMETVQKKVEAIIAELTKEAGQIIEDISAKADKCFKDNGLNIPKVVECLEGLVDPATTDVTKFVEDIQKAVEDANTIIGDATTNLTDCVTKVAHDAQTKETQIINNFQKCIDDITNPSTTSA